MGGGGGGGYILKFVIVKRGGVQFSYVIILVGYSFDTPHFYTFLNPPSPHPRWDVINVRTVPNKSHLGKLFARHTDLYRIYSINRPGRLLHFWTLRVGAYSRLGAY